MSVWKKITKNLSGIFGAADRAEDTADRLLKMQQPVTSHEEPVDPITEWREDSAFLASLVAGRKQREHADHVEAVATITATVGHGTSHEVAAPKTAQFKKITRS